MSGAPVPGRDVFVVLTHLLSPRIERRIARAREALSATHDVHVVGGFPEGVEPPEGFRGREGFHAFGPVEMLEAGWALKGRGASSSLFGGAADLPVLALARRLGGFGTLWSLEGDVEFTGPFDALTGAFADSSADLIGTSLRPAPRNWPHRRAAVRPEGWSAPEGEVIAFLPALRASRAAIDAVERFYAAGGDGHHEWVWPFAAQASGLTLEDMGGDGAFVREGNRNRFYTSSLRRKELHPGTFRYRPVMTRPGARRMTLWHPVKDWLTPEEAGEGGGAPWPGRAD
jgi:hypothetical protein